MKLFKQYTGLLAVMLVVSSVCGAHPHTVRGSLVIIGDGAEEPQILEQFVALAGGPDRARIVILPMASSIPDTVGMRQEHIFRRMGVKQVRYLILTREQAMQSRYADTLTSATGIFFTGGDQSKLAAVLVGTPVHTKLLDLYRDGAVIGGGSAGAAIMSRVMITGNELRHTDSSTAFVTIQKNNIETIEGLGFLDDAIIDQHFVRRKRHNRLMSIVLEHPQLLGIGIDEQTAIIVRPDKTCEVIGRGCVVVYDARNAKGIRSTQLGVLGGTYLTMHVLLSGDRFNIRNGRVVSAKGSP